MSLQLVTADTPLDTLPISTRPSGTGIVIGVFLGAIFWLGLGLGIAAGWAIWS